MQHVQSVKMQTAEVRPVISGEADFLHPYTHTHMHNFMHFALLSVTLTDCILDPLFSYVDHVYLLLTPFVHNSWMS